MISYKGTDFFLLCFGINSRASFVNAGSKWVRELAGHPDSQGKPYLLIGTKCDLRSDPTIKPEVSTSHLSEFIESFLTHGCHGEKGIRCSETQELAKMGWVGVGGARCSLL